MEESYSGFHVSDHNMDCARCGAIASKTSAAYYEDEGYHYCSECWDLFEQIKENGVGATWRANRAGAVQEVYVITYQGSAQGYQHTQVEALARCLDLMEKYNCRGLFEYSQTGSRWLVDEYLKEHPNIADDVEDERSGFLSSLF